MKKLLFSLGLVAALLGATIFTRSQAALPPQTAATVPATLYKLSSHTSTFVDISTNPNAVALGAELPDGTDLVNYFFEPTEAGGITPAAAKKITKNADANTTDFENCFPLGFDFKISGRTMRYFLVNALGGAYFSPEPTRTPATSSPTGSYTGNCIKVDLWTFKKPSYSGGTAGDQNGTGKIKKVAGKTPAYYLIEGEPGHRVLTTQHHILLMDNDEWTYQLKFYEATSNFELVVGDLHTEYIATNTDANNVGFFYGLNFGLFESSPSVGTSASCTNDTINGSVVAARPWQLGISVCPMSGQHKLFASRLTTTERGWDNPVPATSLGWSKTLEVTPNEEPEPGRTIRFNYPECQNPLPTFPESFYSVTKNNTDNAFTATITYNTELWQERGMYNLTDAGTIVAVSSASPDPDFTLENGTFYFKGHEFPESEDFIPTVLCNQMPTTSNSGNPPTSTYYINKNTPITVTLSGLDKFTSRYIHIFRMSLACDGRPVYSPLCFTIAREPILDPPALLETVGMPTVNSVKLHAKPADGLSVLIVKSPNSINLSPRGQLKKGSKIGTAEVVALLDKETTWDQPLAAGEGCYFVAITVNTSNANKYIYSPANRLWCPARAAYNGLPGLLDMSQETCAIPNKELEGYNIKSAGWQALEGNTYRDMPLGWTRTLTLADGKKHAAFGLGHPGYANNVPVAVYSTALVGSAINTDAITVPVLANKNRIAVTYDVQFWSADASGGCSTTAPKDNDQIQLQYAIGDGAWQNAANWRGNTLPAIDGNNVYKLSYTIVNDNLSGQYIRFRFLLNTVSRDDWANWVSIKSLEIKEDKLCATPSGIRQNKSQTTTTQIPLSWNDPNLVEAGSYIVAYKRAEAAGDWVEKTVNAKNATLTGLRSSTTYLVRITTVCGEDNDSYPTDTIYMTSAYTFPYTESMAQRDTAIKIQGSNATAVLYNPIPGKPTVSYIPRKDGGVTTYTGQLPGTGNASLTQSDGYTNGAFSSNFTYNKVANVKMDDGHGTQRLQLKAVGVNERAQYAWLMTPVIYTVDLAEGESLVVRFKATSASRGAGSTTFTKGSVGSKYNSASLKVLVSNTGDFSNNNVIGTVYVGSTTIDSTSYEFELPTPLTGSVQVAFYYANPNYINDNAVENNDDYMTFEIFDVRFEYKNDVAICPALEGLERTFLTPHSATFEWAKSDSAKYYEFAYGPAEDEEYATTVKLTEAQYTITGLDEQSSYKVMVTGYCDEEGENAAPDPLTAEFTTPEGCHTPTAFKVQDVTYYGATFISKQTQSILTEREVYAVSSDNAHKKVFKQAFDTLVQETGLLDNTSYMAQTRSICRYGTGSVDTSEWSAGVSFTTPADPANLPDTFNILLAIQPAGAGSATGAGQYIEDETITIKATANEGYVFVEWQDEDGNTLSKNTTYTMTAKQDDEIIIDPTLKTHNLSYTAVFRKVFTITLNTEPAGTTGGTVTGAGTYNEGTEVTLTATPKSTYLFVEWQNEDGNPVSTNATYKFTPTASGTYTAIFRLKEYYTLDVTVTPNDDWGSVNFSPKPNEDEQYQEGREVTLTATPAQYCKFVEWQDNNGNTVSTDATLKVAMDGNKTFKAVFAQIRYTVTLKSDPNTTYGTIKGTSGSTSTGGTFVAGTTRRIVAQPKSGYAFVKWMSGTKQLGTDTVLTFVLTRDTTITAYFKEKDSLEVKVTVSPATAGSVTGAGKIKRGTQAKLTATAAAHYAFKEWRRLDNSTITSNPYTFTPDRDYTFTAVFRDLAQYTITVQNDGGGTVTDAGGNTVTGAQTYEEGSKVTLTATADEGYTFTEWQDKDGETLSTDATYEFTATGSATVKAVFTENTKYTVTLQRVPSSTAGTTTGAGKFEENTEVTITATPAKGYQFVEWQKTDGTMVSTNPSYTFTLTANVTFKAVFEALVEIKVTVDPEGAGTVTGAGTYEQGDEVTLTATPDDDYLFAEWLDADDGHGLTEENPYTFEATESLNIKAFFREKNYFNIDVPCIGGDEDEDDLGSVNIPGDDEGKWKEGETVTMTAQPNPYCKFVKWLDKNGNTLSTNPTYTFVITQDTTFQAVFAHIQYTVTLKSDPNTTYGTINGTTGSTSTGGTFNAGTTRHLEAKPKSGYAFVKWMSGTTELGTNPVFEFVLTKDTTITAYFKEKEELTITVNVEPTNAGTVTGNGNVQRGNDAVLTATANAGYKFLYWERVDGTQHEENPYTLVQPKRDYTFKAVFRAKAQYTITVSNLPNAAAGTVTKTGFLANGKAEEDATITLTATPAEGYAFVEWQNAAGDQESTNATLSFQATANATYYAVFEELPTPEYTITVNIEPANGGKIFNDGSYPEGSVVSLKARPNRDYAFDGWYDAAGTTKLSADTVYKVTLTADVTYTAKFKEKESVDVTVDVLPEVLAGSVTGAGSYEKNQTATLTATAGEGYTFYRWVDVDNDNEPVSTANPYTFTVTKGVHYAAEFRGQYEVTLNILPDDNAGEVKGDGFYRMGSKVTLEATAYTGYVFVEWQDADGSMVSENRTHEITVTGNMTFTAKFVTVDEEHRHTITVRRLPSNEAGTVSGNGRYLHGDFDTLRATPAENYLFVAWLKQNADDATKYDTVSKKNPYIFTVEGDSSYTALFRLRARYTIDVDIVPNDEAGTATGDGEYREGRAVTLEAMPNEGYVFVAWVLKTDSPSAKDTVSRTTTYTFIASRNATYKAVFRKTAANYTVELKVSPANAGTVSGDGVYKANATVTITAKPNAGYRFVGWRNTAGSVISYDPSYQFKITQDMTLTAVFSIKDVMTITLNKTPENAGTVTGAGEYVRNAEATITATPFRGYRFVEWLDEAGQSVSTDAAYTFMITTDATYTAVFAERDLETYTLSLDVLPSGSEAGTVMGAGQYLEGTLVTITAVPNSGYKFKSWLCNGVTISEEPVYSFEIESDLSCWALFEEATTDKETVLIALRALPNNEAGTLKGAGKYDKGAQVTIIAEAASNYTFAGWLNPAGDTVSKSATYTFTAESDITLSAAFKSKNSANEQLLKAAFNVGAGNGHLYIDNLNAVTVREVAVFNTVGRQLAHFTPNSNANLALPVDARYAVLVVRVVTEQGMAIYKVYLH